MSDIEICEAVWVQFLIEGMEVPEFSEFLAGYKLYEAEKKEFSND